jgi:hypothetical protein
VKKAEWRKQSGAAKSFPRPASRRAPSALPRAFVTARPVLRFEVLSIFTAEADAGVRDFGSRRVGEDDLRRLEGAVQEPHVRARRRARSLTFSRLPRVRAEVFRRCDERPGRDGLSRRRADAKMADADVQN